MSADTDADARRGAGSLQDCILLCVGVPSQSSGSRGSAARCTLRVQPRARGLAGSGPAAPTWLASVSARRPEASMRGARARRRGQRMWSPWLSTSETARGLGLGLGFPRAAIRPTSVSVLNAPTDLRSIPAKPPKR